MYRAGTWDFLRLASKGIGPEDRVMVVRATIHGDEGRLKVSARRGDLWLIDFGEPVGGEQAGRRPAVVVSADGLNEGPAGVVMVVPVTSARRGLPSHIEIDDPGSGLDQVSYAKCEDLESISDRRLMHRLGAVAAAVMVDIERVLRYLLDL